MSEHILMDVQDNIATITFNRPESRNALSQEMREGLMDFTAQAGLDPKIRCVVLRGAAGNFMAGGDIKGFQARQSLPPEERKALILKGIHGLHFAIYRMRQMPKPVLASVAGAAAGAGVSLVAACDLAIAADDSFFILAYANIGLSPDASSTYFLPRIMGMKRVAELTFLPERFDAETALNYGLINRVVPAAELEAETDKLAQRLANGPTVAYGHAKALLESSLNTSLETQLELEGHAIAECMVTEDHAEGVTAFLEKRSPQFKGR
ncbi:MAG: enoyl-CoA hydratase-related protein [SAR324 cluster bacterium]|nr:enoyl-CoA hydratase-related protein [SAR324 cluster bacterium]MCZ6629247.1 enoyl-CoA hydratase-related protein [SAR324 cluster bacterium]MCZ6645884.1 enoyl-CoA hydratase-related protein [SAR324 cluster bacterium]